MEQIIREHGYAYGFSPQACGECGGKCCTGESGYIWVDSGEIEDIASFLCIDNKEFIEKFLVKIEYRYSIKEKEYLDGCACYFFDEKKLQCSIYEVRPSQCKTFPFWNYFKTREEEVKKECPGIRF